MYVTGVIIEWTGPFCVPLYTRSEGMFVIVCLAGLTRVMDVAPHWSILRNPMIMRIYNDVILRFTTGHWSVHA